MNEKLAHEGNTMRITTEKISEDGEKPFTSSLNIRLESTIAVERGGGWWSNASPPYHYPIFPR